MKLSSQAQAADNLRTLDKHDCEIQTLSCPFRSVSDSNTISNNNHSSW